MKPTNRRIAALEAALRPKLARDSNRPITFVDCDVRAVAEVSVWGGKYPDEDEITYVIDWSRCTDRGGPENGTRVTNVELDELKKRFRVFTMIIYLSMDSTRELIDDDKS